MFSKAMAECVSNALGLDYRMVYEATVYEHTGAATAKVRIQHPLFSDEGTFEVAVGGSGAGIEAELKQGSRCLVGFVNGDPQRPYIAGVFQGSNESGTTVVLSDRLLLGSSGANLPLTLAPPLQKILNGIIDVLRTAAPQSPVGPVPFSGDVTGSSTQYGAGGLLTVLTAIQLDINSLSSTKVFTDA